MVFRRRQHHVRKLLGAVPYSADFHTWANFGRAVWVWTPNANWLNEFRFGYDYGNFPDYSNECDHGTGPNYAALEKPCVDGDRQCSYESGGPGRDIWGAFPIVTVTGFDFATKVAPA